ncbi:DUF934 domain-containing protein [Gammaproteobacteria bacterium AS21]
MPLLINGKVVVDSWLAVDSEKLVADQQEQLDAINQANVPVILPLAIYVQCQDQLKLDVTKVGVKVVGDDDLSSLLAVLDSVALVAIDFPVLRDGRGFSIARSVARTGFKGEVRATGDVGFDRLDYMHRSGFNSFLISDDLFTENTVKAFTEIDFNYQPTHQRSA